MTAYALVQTEIYAACMNRLRIAGRFTVCHTNQIHRSLYLSPRVPGKVCVPWAFETEEGSTLGGYRVSESVDMFPSRKGEAAHAGGRNSWRLQPAKLDVANERERAGRSWVCVILVRGASFLATLSKPPSPPDFPIPPLRAAKMNSQYRLKCLIPA